MLYKVVFIRNRPMNVGPSSWTMGKNHLPWSDFMAHDVNGPSTPKHSNIGTLKH